MNYHDTDQNASGQEPLKPVFRKEYLTLKAEREREQAEEKKAAAAAATKLSNPAEYPIGALMPTLAGAVMAIAYEAQCPLEMAANCALGYASLAAIGAANVQMPKGGLVPPAVYAVTVAESAEGKTRANRFACVPIEEREADLAKTHKANTTAHKSRLAAWSSMRDQAMKDKRLDTIEKKVAAIALLGSEPVAPRLPTLLLKDSTPEAIVRGFATMQPALGLFNSEGSQFLNGHGFTPENKLKTAALLTDTWSGEEISQDRIGRGFSRISNPRLAMHMLVQPKAAKAFLSDEILYDQGLLPRILVAYPKSLIGTCVAVDEKSPPWVGQAHGVYCRQVLTLLESWKTTIDGAEPELRTLVMAQGARKAWFSYYNEIEPQLLQGGRYAHVKSTARRSAEQAARIAAVITLLESPFQETIVADVMTSAIRLARWYLDEWLRLKEVASVADEITDSEAIAEWAVKQKMGEHGLRTFTLNELTKYGPNHLRPKGGDVEKIRARRRAALNYLVDIGRLYVHGNSAISWRDGKSGVKIQFTVSSDQ